MLSLWLNGVDTTLKIDKQGRSLVVTLEQKLASFFYDSLIESILAVLVVILIHFLVNNFEITKLITAVFAGWLLYQHLNVVREESLIMVYSLGYQITSKSVLGQKTLFIPWNQVQNVFINEIIIRHKVIHSLTILTKDKDGEKLIPLFLELQPRLKHLELIYRHIKAANS